MNENNTPGEASEPQQPAAENAQAPVQPPAPTQPVQPAEQVQPPTPAQPQAVQQPEQPQAPQQSQAPEQRFQAPQGWQPPTGAPGQHGAPTAPPTPAAPTASAAASAPYAAPSGAAFGPQATASQHPHGTVPQHGTTPQPAYGSPTQPTLPIDPTLLAAPADDTQTPRKTGGPVKVAALLLAAALVGGVAGFGGSAIGGAFFNQPVSSSASGPQTVTVNNPGSVNETTAIATDVLPSVVTIEVAGSQESGSGSGVVLSKDGYVLTNTHVVTLGGSVADPTIRVTTSDGHIYSATVVGTDPIYDLAVIKLEGASDLKPIEFGESSKLNVGDTAVAVGAPLGLSNSVTTGIVSALNRSIQVASSAVPDSTDSEQPGDGEDQGSGGDPFQFDIPGMGGQQQATQSISISVIQTDAAINPGNSGGALVDSKGRLIGVNVAIATAGQSSGSSGESGSIGVGFAIPADIAKRVSDEIIENGAATHGLLGATVRDASSLQNAAVAGAVIDTPTPGGGAAEAGLKKGDIITEFNGQPVSSATDLTAQVRAEAAGSTVKIAYVRSGKTYETEATLGELKL